MPKEVVYETAGEFFLDANGDERLPEAAKKQNEKFYRRGSVIRWDKLGMVQVATGSIGIADHAELNTQYATFSDPQSLARYIKMLQRAGRNAFGESAW